MTQKPSDSHKPSDSVLFPLSDLDRAIVDIIPLMPTPPRWPALNAIQHLNQAWKLREIDPPMAVFRAITAEEESATALFLSLKRRRYRHADKLKHKDHVHKNAVTPFFGAVARVIGPSADKLGLHVELNKKDNKLLLKFKATHPQTQQDAWVYPTPPLHFSVEGGLAPERMKKEDFAVGVQQIVAATNVKDIIEHVRDRANLRNEILYAGPNGFLVVKGDVEASLREYQRHVFTILTVYMLVDPYGGDQLFVQQVLDAFLKTLKVLPPRLE